MTDSERMRLQLASVGILLDDSHRDVSPANVISVPPVDRAEVRRILEQAGAPASDLLWLVASCPSIDDARLYQPPAREAWCFTCDGARPIDKHGCMACREGA